MKIKIGDIYEDCGCHPCLCVKVDGDDIDGISLVDASYPRCCSIHHCAPKKISINKAMQMRETYSKNNLPLIFGKMGWAFENWFKDHKPPKGLKGIYQAKYQDGEDGLKSDWGIMYDGTIREFAIARAIAKVLANSPTGPEDLSDSDQTCAKLLNCVPYIFHTSEILKGSPAYMLWISHEEINKKKEKYNA